MEDPRVRVCSERSSVVAMSRFGSIGPPARPSVSFPFKKTTTSVTACIRLTWLRTSCSLSPDDLKYGTFSTSFRSTETYLSLGALIWAACGKDEGYTPSMILDQTNRHSRYQESDLRGENLVRQVDLKVLKQQWILARERAEVLFARLAPG